MTSAPQAKSPFAFLGTLSIEGARLKTDEGVPSSGLITLPLECVLRVRRVIEGYAVRYRPRDPETGAALLLHGGHGVGKTHTLRYAMLQLSTMLATAPDATPSMAKSIQLYVKAEDGDFLSLYRRAANQLDLEILRDIVVASFAVAAGEQVAAETRNTELGETAVETL